MMCMFAVYPKEDKIYSPIIAGQKRTNHQGKLQMKQICQVLLIVLGVFISAFVSMVSYSCTNEGAIPSQVDGSTCLSLRALAERAKANPNDADVVTLCGINRLEGYVVDVKRGDIIIIGKKESGKPDLSLDDLAICIRNIVQGDPDPYCSLDPIPDNITNLNQLMSGNDVDPFDMADEDYIDLLESTLGPQQVIIGGVPRESKIANTMIYADYIMKEYSQGLRKDNLVQSCLDLMKEESESSFSGEASSMSRFWFMLASDEPKYLSGKNIALIDKCNVNVLTEKQKQDINGELIDAGAKDPTSLQFAASHSKAFKQLCERIPEYASLDQFYRLYSLVKSMLYQNDLNNNNLDMGFWLTGYNNLYSEPLPDYLPGLANAERVEANYENESFRQTRINYYIVAGGVSMETSLQASNFKKLSYPAQIIRRVLANRPDASTLSWAA